MIDALIEGLWATSAAIVVVLLLRGVWRRGFGAERAPLLWIVVPATLLAVSLPAPQAPASDEVAQVWIGAASATAPASAIISDWTDALAAAWLAGALVSAAHFARQQRRFRRRVGRLQPRGDGTYAASGAGCSPAVLGVLRPRIVLPADFEQRYSPEQQRLIVQHERSHARRFDVAANAVATALRAVYWFNPLVHYAAARLRHDHELASDAEVVRLNPHARRRYADTLLDVQLAVPGLPVGCLWQSSHPLKERITMLKTPLPGNIRRRAGLVTALVAAIGCAGIAWAAQPPDPASPVRIEPKVYPVAPTGDDLEPTYRAVQAPRYPKAAIVNGEAGDVILRVLVGADGAPKDISVEQGASTLLDEAAIAAVRQWKFNPRIDAGRRAEQWVLVPISFKITGDAASGCDGEDPAACGQDAPATPEAGHHG